MSIALTALCKMRSSTVCARCCESFGKNQIVETIKVHVGLLQRTGVHSCIIETREETIHAAFVTHIQCVGSIINKSEVFIGYFQIRLGDPINSRMNSVPTYVCTK